METEKIIHRNLSSVQDEILQFAQRLIKIPTENPPGRSYKECIQVIRAKLEDFALAPNVIEVAAPGDKSFPRYCLLSSFGESTKTVYFHGHYDVVPAARKKQFYPYIKDNKLFGRGASDMKGGLVSMVYAVRLLQVSNLKLKGKIILVFVPDEETGGSLGTEFLFRKGLLDEGEPVGMFMPEATGGSIWNACRGAISLLVRIKGKASHVTLQHQGINAFDKMLTVVNELKRYKREVEKRKTNYEVGPGESRNSILMLGGISRGGTNFNIVPDEFSFTIDRRINPEENLNDEKQKLLEILFKARNGGVDLDVEILQEGDSASISADHPVGRALASAIKVTGDKEAEFRMCPGLLETRFYLKHGIPAFAYGPGILSASHGPEEFVYLEDLYLCTAVYALTAFRLLSEGGKTC